MTEPTTPSRSDTLRGVSVDQIENWYRRLRITAGQRNDFLREKGHATTAEVLDKHGYAGAVWEQMITHLTKGFDNLVESATRDVPDKTSTMIGHDLYYSGLAMWAQVQMITAPFTAIGEVTGQVAENMALRAGASPMLARVINVAVDVGSGFLPVGGAVRSAVKGVKGIADTMKSGQAAKALATQEKALAGAKQGIEAMAQGLAAEKPDLAARLLREAEAQGVKATAIPPSVEQKIQMAATQAENAAHGGKVVEGAQKVGAVEGAAGKVVEGAAGKVEPPLPSTGAALSPQEQLIKDMAAFRKTIKDLTETQTHAQTQKMADRLGYSIEDLRRVVPGAALDEKQMLSYLNALDPQVTKMEELARAVAAGGDETVINAYARQVSDFLSISPTFRGAEVTGGRAVEVLKTRPDIKGHTDMLAGWDPEAMARGKPQDAIRLMAEDMVAMADQSTDKLKAFALQAQAGLAEEGPGWWAKSRELYINLLLARPLTQARNLIGNSVSAANALTERFAGGVFSAEGGQGVAGRMGQESWYLLKGMHAAIGDGMKAFGEAYKGVDVAAANMFDNAPGAIGGRLGRIVRGPGDTLRGMDNFFKSIFRSGSYYADAYRMGVEAGKTGEELAQYVATRAAFPTKTMRDNADAFAMHNTFQDELGTLGKAVRTVGQTGPLVLWFPFMKTPINLLKYGWDRTPGLQMISKKLYEDIAEGGLKADLAIGRLTMSNLQAMFIYNLAQEGLLTGSGPVDPGLRRAWRATNEPYSVKGPGGWIPIANLDPASTPIGMIADFAQVLNQLDEPTAQQTAMALSFTLMHGTVDKSYWRTLSDLVDISSGVFQGHTVGTKGRDVLLSPAVTVLSGGPLGQAITKAVDPTPRETRDWLDWVVSKVPGYSATVPAIRDSYGDPVLPAQAVGGAWVGIASPLKLKPDTEDWIKQEGERLQVRVPAVPWSIGGTTRDDFDIRAPRPEDGLPVELTTEQRDRWQEMTRRLLRDAEHGMEKTLRDNPEYHTNPQTGEPLSPIMQRELFMGKMADYRAVAKDALPVVYPDLAEKLIKSQVKKVLPFLNDAQQGEAAGQMQQGIAQFQTLSPEAKMNLMRWGVLDDEGAPEAQE